MPYLRWWPLSEFILVSFNGLHVLLVILVAVCYRWSWSVMNEAIFAVDSLTKGFVVFGESHVGMPNFIYNFRRGCALIQVDKKHKLPILANNRLCLYLIPLHLFSKSFLKGKLLSSAILIETPALDDHINFIFALLVGSNKLGLRWNATDSHVLILNIS